MFQTQTKLFATSRTRRTPSHLRVPLMHCCLVSLSQAVRGKVKGERNSGDEQVWLMRTGKMWGIGSFPLPKCSVFVYKQPSESLAIHQRYQPKKQGFLYSAMTPQNKVHMMQPIKLKYFYRPRNTYSLSASCIQLSLVW